MCVVVNGINMEIQKKTHRERERENQEGGMKTETNEEENNRGRAGGWGEGGRGGVAKERQQLTSNDNNVRARRKQITRRSAHGRPPTGEKTTRNRMRFKHGNVNREKRGEETSKRRTARIKMKPARMCSTHARTQANVRASATHPRTPLCRGAS